MKKFTLIIIDKSEDGLSHDMMTKKEKSLKKVFEILSEVTGVTHDELEKDYNEILSYGVYKRVHRYEDGKTRIFLVVS